ncbi:MAG: hypothetical protein ACREFE_14000 [Limisphaerales bacterium]
MVTIKYHIKVETQGAVVVGSSAVLGHKQSIISSAYFYGSAKPECHDSPPPPKLQVKPMRSTKSNNQSAKQTHHTNLVTSQVITAAKEKAATW